MARVLCDQMAKYGRIELTRQNRDSAHLGEVLIGRLEQLPHNIRPAEAVGPLESLAQIREGLGKNHVEAAAADEVVVDCFATKLAKEIAELLKVRGRRLKAVALIVFGLLVFHLFVFRLLRALASTLDAAGRLGAWRTFRAATRHFTKSPASK